jgi:hypothetical protein
MTPYLATQFPQQKTDDLMQQKMLRSLKTVADLLLMSWLEESQAAVLHLTCLS